MNHFQNNASEYSLILTDLRMPGMSGAELAKRAKKIRPDIKLMIMTAFEVDRDVRKALPSIERTGFCKSRSTPRTCAPRSRNT
jgi:CheY-like chemotaxis protein